MATKTFEELKQLAIQIRDEKTNKQNTATRVGTAMLEHINKLEQDYYDKNQTDEELKERDDKLTELEIIIPAVEYLIENKGAVIESINCKSKYFINSQTGEEMYNSSSNVLLTDYIDINSLQGKVILGVISQSGVAQGINYYDDNKSYIKTSIFNSLCIVDLLPKPENAKYIRAYLSKKNAEIIDYNDYINRYLGNNLFTENGFYQNTGAFVTFDSYIGTDLIPISYLMDKACTSLIQEQNGVIVPLCYFDKYGGFISAYTSSDGDIDIDFSELTIPEDAVYVGMSSKKEKNPVIIPLYSYDNTKKLSLVNNYIGIDNPKVVTDSFGYNNISEFYRAAIVFIDKAYDEDKLINKIIFTAYETSTKGITIRVGIKDQRNWFIEKKSYYIDAYDIKKNYRIYTIDLKKYNIVVEKGYSVALDTIESDILIARSNQQSDNIWAGNTLTGTMGKSYMPTSITLELDSTFVAFPYKSQFNELQSSVEDNNKKIGSISSQLNILTDVSTKKKYKLIINNGELVTKLLEYRNIVIAGNSLSNHPTVPEYNWYVTKRGMAASVEGHGYVDFIKKKIQEVNGSEPTITLSGSFEREPITYDLSQLDTIIEKNPDCWIIQLGENVTDVSNWQAGIERYVNYIKERIPLCDIYITDRFWSDSSVNLASYNAAINTGSTFITISDLYKKENIWSVGDYTYGSDSEYHYINEQSVAIHPNDNGMLSIANRILSALGYSEISGIRHSITVSESNDYTASFNYANFVENGVVSINVVSEKKLTGASGISEYQILNNEYGDYIVFIMPQTDVVITPIVE